MKVLNFGSLNIDYVYDVNSFVSKGETIASTALNVFSGGKGLNQSLALARAGARVYHAGMVGEDGKFLIDILKDSGVDTSNIAVSKDIRTGNAIIQKDKSGDNCIILFGGANRAVTKEFADKVLSSFDEGDFLVLQNEISSLPYIVESAHKKGMKIVLNPSPMNAEIDKLDLSHIDYFMLNETEAYAITKENEPDPKKQLELLRKRFPSAGILITLGENGSIYCEGDNIITQKAAKVNVVDTTAAGDTFSGYFIEGLLKGEDIKTVLKRSSAASGIAVSRQGAAPSIPYRKEVDERMYTFT